MTEELKIIISAEVGKLKSAVADAKSQISGIGTEGESSSSKMSSALEKAGNAAKKAGKVVATAMAAGLAAATAGVVAIGKAAIESYAEYEQLVGGVETLFKDSAGIVQEYAANAYKTAGLSANEYMSTVTSFSASLLSSLGGDTAAAAAYADQAITDMADNANKMGTSITDIQNAYQGFAKQNYTMLDNLKLGYGGTKSEMERLIADANRVKVANGEMADLSIDSFADVVEAIHIIQTEMGITGTTAQEAMATISGSVAMTKAAWSNLLTGIADDNADFDKLMDNFVESATAAFNNILPRLVTALNGISKLIDGVLPPIIAKIPQIIEEVLPQLLTAGINIVTSLIEGITLSLPALTNAVVTALPLLITGVLSVLPALLDAGIQMIAALISGIAQMLPEVITAVIAIIPQLVTAITSNVGLILEAGITLLMALIQAVPTIIAALVPEIGNIVSTVVSTLIANMPLLIQGAITLFMAILQAIPQVIAGLASAVPTIVSAVVSGLVAGVGSILAGAGKMFAGVITKAGEAKDKAVAKFEELKLKASEKFEAIKSATSEKWEAVKNAVTNKLETAKNNASNKLESIKTAVSNKLETAKSKASTAFEGIKSAASSKLESAKSTASSKMDSIKSAIQNKMDTAKSKASSALDSIKSAMSSKLDSAKSTASSKLTSIASAFGSKMETAKSKVKSAIDKIKGFMNFSWSLPKLKMPHVSISGKFSLNPPSVPKFSISWYQHGGVFDNPTLFPWAGGVGGLGENGAEAIVPLEKNTQWLDRIAEMLNQKMGGGTPIILQVDGKTFAQTCVNSMNDLTRQTGSLQLKLV